MVTMDEKEESKGNTKEPKFVWDEDEEFNPWGSGPEELVENSDLSVHAVTGTQGPHTLKIHGNIKEKN